MGCKNRSTKVICKSEKLVIKNLENRGREQFFWHYPGSRLPIRDVINKTEPHVEIGAENYLRPCLPPNIRGFCHSKEKYLFLCTTCNNHEVGEGRYFGRRFVVGYITKECCRNMGDRCAVIGKSHMVSFDERLSYDKLGFSRSRGMRRLGIKETTKLLELIRSERNLRERYVREMIKKEAEARKNKNKIPLDSECLGSKCKFRNKCLRHKGI